MAASPRNRHGRRRRRRELLGRVRPHTQSGRAPSSRRAPRAGSGSPCRRYVVAGTAGEVRRLGVIALADLVVSDAAVEAPATEKRAAGMDPVVASTRDDGSGPGEDVGTAVPDESDGLISMGAFHIATDPVALPAVSIVAEAVQRHAKWATQVVGVVDLVIRDVN